MNQPKENMTNGGYNILPTTPALPTPASNFRLLSVSVGWACMFGFVMACAKQGEGVFACAFVGLALSLAIAALGLVWGVFQHVLKTVVRIVRTGN